MTSDYARVEQAILYLEQNFRRQPSLLEVAEHVGLSEFHFQRLFTRWAGISPKRFLQFQTVEHAKRLLAERRPLLDVTYDAGLSGPGRLHDLFVQLEAMTPGEYKRLGEGLEIAYGFHETPFGECVLAATERGIAGLAFVSPGEEGGRERAVADLATRWPLSRLRENPDVTRPLADRIFGAPGDGAPASGPAPLGVLVKGTNFQVRVWEALLRIPAGTVTTYEEVAQAIGAPDAVRAVGAAVGRNPVAYLIPCHRVIRKSGRFGEYYWGAARKRALLGWESARRWGEGAGEGEGEPAAERALARVDAGAA